MTSEQHPAGTVVPEVRRADALPWRILFRAAGVAFCATVALVVALPARVDAAEMVARRDIPYADPPHERSLLDVYSTADAEDRPVVFWIHGGGWQKGDKSDVQVKPQALIDRGYVFVSTNYRLLPRRCRDPSAGARFSPGDVRASAEIR